MFGCQPLDGALLRLDLPGALGLEDCGRAACMQGCCMEPQQEVSNSTKSLSYTSEQALGERQSPAEVVASTLEVLRTRWALRSRLETHSPEGHTRTALAKALSPLSRLQPALRAQTTV